MPITGIDTSETGGTEGSVVNFGRIALQPGSLPLHYGVESGEDADDEGGGRWVWHYKWII